MLAATPGVVGAAVAWPAAMPTCPLHDYRAVSSTRPGADGAMVPAGAVALLVCRYSGFTEPPPLPNQGPSHRLIAVGRLADQSTISRLSNELNAIPPRRGPISCPADLGDELVAYFVYPSAPANPVAIGLSGCEGVTNGQIQRVALGAPVVGEIARLARPSTLGGRLQVCGGPAPGGCRTEKFTSCDQSGCITADRVAIFALEGRHVATVRLRQARFSLLVPAGRYRLVLLGDGRHVHGQPLQTAHASTRAGRTTSVVFGVSVP